MSSAEPHTAADLEYHIAKLSLAPGDVLVVKVAHTLNGDIGGNIRAHFERAIGGHNNVLVIDNSIDLQVIDGRLLSGGRKWPRAGVHRGPRAGVHRGARSSAARPGCQVPSTARPQARR